MGGIIDDPHEPIAIGQSRHWLCEKKERELRAEVQRLREQVRVLRETLFQGLHSDCPTWMLADDCQTLWHNLARAALAATEPKP